MKGSAKCRIWGGLARLWVTQGRRQCHNWIACILLPVRLFRNCASVAPFSRYSELFVESRRLWLTPPLFAPPPPVRISRRSLASEKLGRSPVSFDKYWAPGLRQPSDQASRLGLWVFWKLAAIPSTSTIAVVIITQPVSWYSFTVPRRVEGWVDLGTAVKVRSPCPRLYIAAAVTMNTTIRSVIWTWVLSHRSQTETH